MPDEDQSDDLNIQTPGDSPADSAPSPAPAKGKKGAASAAAPSPAPESATLADASDDTAGRITALETENAQLRATVEQLNDQLAEASVSRADAAPAEPRAPRLIGQDWSSMTAAEAEAAGCTQRVLCRDGYFIPA